MAVKLLLGSALETPAAMTVLRVGGAGLFALGIACWLACGDAQSRAARGVVAAMLFYDIGAAVILAFAGLGLGLHGLGLWPAVLLHACAERLVHCVFTMSASCLRIAEQISRRCRRARRRQFSGQSVPFHLASTSRA